MIGEGGFWQEDAKDKLDSSPYKAIRCSYFPDVGWRDLQRKNSKNSQIKANIILDLLEEERGSCAPCCAFQTVLE